MLRHVGISQYQATAAATASQSDEAFSFSLQLTAEAHVGADDVTETARAVDLLLRELERRIDPSGKARASWKWSEPDPTLQFTATRNGVSADTLSHVVGAAQEGFERAAAAVETGLATTDWPPEFSDKARSYAERILQRLERLQSIVVQATGHDPLEIREANIGKIVRAQDRRRRIFSSVDGVLRVLSGGDRLVWAGLREHRTNAYVRCSFDAAEWRERLGSLWEHRVVVEGMVAYDDQRRPRSIVDVKRVTPRTRGPVSLTELAGSAPSLTGGLPAEDFVALIRRDG
jgi:hypothetical protein